MSAPRPKDHVGDASGATAPAPILLVDDQRENRLAMASMIDDVKGIEIIHAASGAEALRQLRLREFALVLLDVVMPDIDGFETAARMRAEPDID